MTASAAEARALHDDGLDVVVVSYRSRALLQACLASLRAHPPGRPLDVHVVDNASGDGSAELIGAEFPGVDLVRNEENRGFAVASNQGIRRGRRAYVLLLNPDTRVTPGALDRLLAVLDADARIGICGPRLERPDGSFDHAARRSFPTILGALGHFTRAGRRRGSPARLAQYRAPTIDGGQVDSVNGAFMLIRRSALEEVGLLDEGYWMYMEDLDLSYRFAEAGWLSWYEPGVTVHHLKGGSSGPVRGPRLTWAFHRGMGRFYRKHYAASRPPLLNLVVYVGILAKAGLSTLGGLLRRISPEEPPEPGDPPAP